ncbi:MAG: ABC transporter substrate-binding protein [Chromatiales bacterium]|nr:MAG: ABC transporter substrate-binding protein [Chromatiales bacterium]
MTDNPLIDAIGTRHEPAAGPARIVSLVPSVTELLCDLGLGEQLVGRTGFCVHPKEPLRAVNKVGGTKDVNLAAIRELRPTHVVLNVDENRRETADALAEFVPHLVVTHPQGPRDNLGLYRLLGGIFHCEDQAARLGRELAARLAALGNQAAWPERKVLYLIWREPWMTVSADTYIARMLELVNWQPVPVPGEARYPEIELAELTDLPDLVLLSSEPYPFRDRHVPEIQAELGDATPVHLIAGDMVSWYGSRAVAGVAYLEDFARQVAA